MTSPSALFWSLLMPWQFLLISLSFLPGALADLYRKHGIQALSWPRIQTAWFSAFWSLAGSNIRKMNGARITALLEGRVTKGQVVDQPVVAPLSGVVLEIGPGLGFWVDLFAQFEHRKGSVKTRSQAADGADLKIYGIEPSADAHPTLKKHIKDAGLEGTYEIIPAGIESLMDYNIEPGSVDCIVSILCLCGIPEPEKNIGELYKYLKKGGRWYVYEHVQNRHSGFMRFYQALANIVWPYAIGGCELCRNTENTLRNAGSWERIDLAQPVEETWHQVIPHTFGTLTK